MKPKPQLQILSTTVLWLLCFDTTDLASLKSYTIFHLDQPTKALQSTCEGRMDYSDYKESKIEWKI